MGIAIAAVFWCTYSSSGMFVTVLSMSNQRLLIAYPIGLFYAAFAILAVMTGDKLAAEKSK